MDKLCPLIRGKCAGHECEWYVHLVGKHPQSGAEQDEWGCAISWLPILLVENAKETRQTAASTDKMHNLFAGLAQQSAVDRQLGKK